MTEYSPKFSELSKIEEDALLSRLEAVRKTISHAGEKGRALESEVIKLLRAFLPAEYGLSTGFVVYHTTEGIRLSPQLDVIIYDAIRSGPIARLGTCEVFPLEAVYAYVEVKATLQSTSNEANKFADNSIENCILKNKTLRAMRRRKYYVPIPGTTNKAKLHSAVWMPIRSYVFAFEVTGATAKNPALLAERISKFSRNTKDVHLHGVFAGDSAFYFTVAIDPREAKPEDHYHVKYTTKHLLSAFKWSLIHSLSRFPRHEAHWTPATDQYNEKRIRWGEYPQPSGSVSSKTSFDDE